MKMYWISKWVLGFIFIFVWGCSPSGSNDQPFNESRKYGIKSGIVEFAPIDIMGVVTKRTIYFDDYGSTEREETIAKGNIFGLTSESHSISLVKDGYVYTYDLHKLENGKDITSKVVTKARLVPYMLLSLQQFSITKEMKKNISYKEEGYEVVAGFRGNKYSICLNKDFPESIISGVHYKNVVMKTHLGGVLVIASRFQENPQIPTSLFLLPKGYTVHDLDVNNEGNP
ncbi:hypothetical protein [Williamwhitmania taraxaci]|uniref:Lipoprotein n=1 Tax=Williamwhitmania taraxaci TaxID=1640674 RepID=A0A1G6T1S5_9BACT|nr:hypothetical protein [Williamwhitmania taraxaci]SDD22794.1 hypothetical protein SAMN05216323_11092 [Williamwhitmania taraxaci]